MLGEGVAVWLDRGLVWACGALCGGLRLVEALPIALLVRTTWSRHERTLFVHCVARCWLPSYIPTSANFEIVLCPVARRVLVPSVAWTWR